MPHPIAIQTGPVATAKSRNPAGSGHAARLLCLSHSEAPPTHRDTTAPQPSRQPGTDRPRSASRRSRPPSRHPRPKVALVTGRRAARLATRLPERPSPPPPTTGARQVLIRGIKHLPALDGPGPCDGYAVASVGPQPPARTPRASAAADPAWARPIAFRAGGASGSELRVEVFGLGGGGGGGGSDRYLGCVRAPLPAPGAPASGLPRVQDLPVLNREGFAVRGHDGQARRRPLPPPPSFSAPYPPPPLRSLSDRPPGSRKAEHCVPEPRPRSRRPPLSLPSLRRRLSLFHSPSLSPRLPPLSILAPTTCPV